MAPTVTSLLSRELLDVSKKSAESRGVSPEHFGLYAVRLLNSASLHGFSPKRTVLLDEDRQEIPLPSLRDPSAVNRYPFSLSVGVVDHRQLIEYAVDRGIDEDERVRQSLRMANFVIEHTLNTMRPVPFLHEGEYIELPRLRP